MRLLFVLVWNVLSLVWAVLRWTVWLAFGPRPPEFVGMDLAGPPPPLVRARFWARGSRGMPRSREELHRVLDAAEHAPRVRGLFLRLRGFSWGRAAIDDLRARLERLVAAKKRVVFYAEQASGRDYLLMCAGDTVWLAPEGRLDLTGVRAELTTAGAGLARLGVNAQLVRRGRYKSATETFANERPSPQAKEQVEELLDAMHAELVGSIARGRKIDEAAARARIDGGPYTARSAEAAGLVDGRVWEDELAEKLTGVSGEQARRKGRVAGWGRLLASRPPRWRWRAIRPAILARVPVTGLITAGKSRSLPGGSASTGSQSAVAALDRAARDRRVRAVILHVDSRGGSALASDLIWRAVERCAQKKPVVAWLEDVAASGGYYVAVGATRIVSTPSCIVGSIGVFGGKMELSGLLERAGVHREILTRGANAGMWSWARPFTESERAALEREIGETYDTFLDRVAAGRKLERARAAEVAEGRVYTGRRALELGLVDALGGFDDAVAEARALAKVPEGARLDLVDFGPRAGVPFGWLLRPGGLDALGGPLFAIWPWEIS